MRKPAHFEFSAILLLLVACHFQDAGASIIQVPEDQPSIAAGLASASYGDSLDIATGTYYEHDLSIPHGVSVIGRGGNPEMIVIDAQFQGRVMEGAELDEQTVLAYFTVRQGDAQGYFGSGLRLEGRCTLHDLIIEDNYTAQGGSIGAYCRDVVRIQDCIFRNNRSPHVNSQGGGLRVNGRITTPTEIIDCTFIGNEAGNGGGLYVSAGICEGLIVKNNTAWGNGGGMQLFADRCWVRTMYRPACTTSSADQRC